MGRQDQAVLARQSELIDAVARLLQRKGHAVEHFETHLSRILVAGGLAYKFKKAVCFGFVDFSTLEARRFYCNEEVRLNRRFAPGLYIDVVPVSLDEDSACIDGLREALDYAVRMRAFSQDELWTRRLVGPGIGEEEIDQFADLLADVHNAASPAPEASDWGSPQVVAATAEENLRSLLSLCKNDDALLLLAPAQREAVMQTLGQLVHWDTQQRSLLEAQVVQRKFIRMVRECHGDLHAGNVLTTRYGVEIFDCIEFAPALRWIDVINDLAFILMDLAFHGALPMSFRLLNRYLERTGDYGGLAVLPYYSVHRALVRGKVALLRARQGAESARHGTDSLEEALAYMAFAGRLARPGRGAILITHGYSGSGKTRFARMVVQTLGAVQIRSDIERKRLRGLLPGQRGGANLYEPDMTEKTYGRLLDLARIIVTAGRPVIVDAAFLQHWQRKLFRDLATACEVPFFLFDVVASAGTMRRRVTSRALADTDASDAGLEVLEAQLRSAEPLTEEECASRITLNMEHDMDADVVAGICSPAARAMAEDNVGFQTLKNAR